MKHISILVISFLIIGAGYGQEAEKITAERSFVAWEQFLATQAKYPTSALRSNKEGYVIMELNIDAEGRIGSANLKESTSKDIGAIGSFCHGKSHSYLESRNVGRAEKR